MFFSLLFLLALILDFLVHLLLSYRRVPRHPNTPPFNRHFLPPNIHLSLSLPVAGSSVIRTRDSLRPLLYGVLYFTYNSFRTKTLRERKILPSKSPSIPIPPSPSSPFTLPQSLQSQNLILLQKTPPYFNPHSR